MKKLIKTLSAFSFISLIAVLLLGLPSQLLAQANPLITVNEFGIGSILFPGGVPGPLPGVLTLDPGPGGLTSAMTYDLTGPPSLVAGDLFLTEPGSNIISEVIRFNPAGTGGNANYPASLVFYSDIEDGADAPADTGLPQGNYTNQAFLEEIGSEGNNGVVYTPTAGQPGFVPGFAVVYNIISDIPEPSTYALLGVGVVALLVWRRKKSFTA